MTLTTDPGYRLVYILPHEAYYKSVINGRSISVVKRADDGGCAWEFQFTEKPGIGIQLDVFDDAYAAFTEVAPLFEALAAERPRSLTATVTLLEEFGIVDATQRQEVRL